MIKVVNALCSPGVIENIDGERIAEAAVKSLAEHKPIRVEYTI